jgi:hypothetical protein
LNFPPKTDPVLVLDWQNNDPHPKTVQAKRLKKLVADISLDNAILKEAARGNF